MLPQRLGRIAFVIGITSALLSACSPVSDVAPAATETQYRHSVENELRYVQADLTKKGINVLLKAPAAGAARMATSPVEGNWQMIGWMQFPSALLPGCLNEFDYPQYGYTDQYSSIRHYIDANYYQSLTLTPLQGDGVEIPYGSFIANSNYNYLNFNNWSGSTYWFQNNTIQSGMDVTVIYINDWYMVLYSTNRAGNQHYYTSWIRS